MLYPLYIRYALVLCLGIIFFPLHAQDLTPMRPSADLSTPELVDLILKTLHIQQNFELVEQPDVTAEARVNQKGRIIEYNEANLKKLSYPIVRYALICETIGHHVNEHILLPAFYEDELVEAAEFVGFALFYLDFRESELELLSRWIPNLDPRERGLWERAFKSGYQRGEFSYIAFPSSNYVDKGKGDALKGVPEFPFPPAPASASYDVTSYFDEAETMGNIDDQLSNALSDCGYHASRYFHVKNGFALITRVEQFNKDGTCLEGDQRWSARIAREETFSLGGFLEYFKSLFISDEAYFRVFAFVVTAENWAPDKDRNIEWKEAKGWLNEGANRLPPVIAEGKATPRPSVVALIYEFKVKETDKEEIMSRPSELLGLTHLEKSQLLNQLKK